MWNRQSSKWSKSRERWEEFWKSSKWAFGPDAVATWSHRKEPEMWVMCCPWPFFILCEAVKVELVTDLVGHLSSSYCTTSEHIYALPCQVMHFPGARPCSKLHPCVSFTPVSSMLALEQNGCSGLLWSISFCKMWSGPIGLHFRDILLSSSQNWLIWD